ncbi:MAG: reverse gyrase [candidate division WOR-3 bacterium]|jgi:reverse gyrase
MEIKSIFLSLCPNCGGDIDAERLSKGLPCKNCLPYEDNVCNVIEYGELKKLCDIENYLKEWEHLFESKIKSKPWSLQISWAKRVLLGNSFALLAPTGIGKTSFGITFALYLATKNKKSYIILPTKLLVRQVYNKLKSMGANDKILLAFGDESPKQKEENKKRLKEGDFLILISTSMFLYKNVELIPRDISFLFVDDVDSFLKTAKNIDKALYIIGFSKEDIKKAIELIKLKAKPKKDEKDWQNIEELSKQLNETSKKVNGVIVVSSATSNPKSSRIKLFRELLGFEVGVPTFYLRNVKDVYTPFKEDELVYWIKKLGKGGLVFLSSDKGKEKVYEIINELEKSKIKAISYEDFDDNALKDYEKGKIDVIVGIASYRNPLARGLDLPHIIRYAIFYGVPKIVISLKFESNPSHLLWALASIRPHIAKKRDYNEVRKIDNWIRQLRRMKENKLNGLREDIESFITSKEVLNILNASNDIALRFENGNYYLVISDATGYLQASGRTSRMFAGGITQGLCITLVDDIKAFNHLQKRLKWFSEDINFVPAESINFDEILKKIDEDRMKIREFLKGNLPVEKKEILKPVLVIVESPNKARTIANFFGKAIRRKVENHEVLETSMEDKYLMITSSLGHILDLAKSGGFHGVNVNGEIVPIYNVIEGKEDIIKSLRKLAFEASQVLIATDPDTEGEKIGWDLMELLKPYSKDIKRMEFHEVTKKAIIKALKEPREFNINLVKAQIVRRVADRWVGFEFSKTLQQAFSENRLSAGRVQTPVLGWIIKREEEYKNRIYKVIASINENIKFEVVFEDKKSAQEFFDKLESIELKIIQVREEIKNPLPPYSTDMLLKDANSKYKFSVPKIMELAQTLFELGFITYHRTDSIRVSEDGMKLAKEYIKEEFGENYFNPRGWSDVGTHECIRPTKAMDGEELRSLVLSGQIEGINKEHIMLYDLIFKRFISSQMKAVKVKVADILIKALNKEITLSLNIDILEDGWNKLLYLEKVQVSEGIFKVNKVLKDYPKVFLYTQGEVIYDMKTRGIGRPSTYASTIEKLLERGYIVERKGFLIPTKLGKQVYRYLSERKEMKNFVSEEFTKHLESLMDMVEEGKADYQEILKNLYLDLLKAV